MRHAWNKGLTSADDPRVKKNEDKVRMFYSDKSNEEVIKNRSLKHKETLKEKRKKDPYKYLEISHIIKCPRCGKDFEVVCSQRNFDRGKYKKYCCRSCANTRDHSQETILKIKSSVNLFIQNNHDLYIRNNKNNKKAEETLLKRCICKYCGKEFIIYRKANGRFSKTKYCCDECRHRFVSENNIAKETGGFKEGSAKNYKHGWYKGIHCDSSWELAFVVYMLDHNIEISRYNGYRTYYLENKQHKFYPDFVVDDKLYEIKGIKDKISEAKLQYNPDVIFLYRNDMKRYIEYTSEKYGRNFWETLYE